MDEKDENSENLTETDTRNLSDDEHRTSNEDSTEDSDRLKWFFWEVAKVLTLFLEIL